MATVETYFAIRGVVPPRCRSRSDPHGAANPSPHRAQRALCSATVSANRTRGVIFCCLHVFERAAWVMPGTVDRTLQHGCQWLVCGGSATAMNCFSFSALRQARAHKWMGFCVRTQAGLHVSSDGRAAQARQKRRQRLAEAAAEEDARLLQARRSLGSLCILATHKGADLGPARCSSSRPHWVSVAVAV